MADCITVDCGRTPVPGSPPPANYAGADLMAHDFDSLLRVLLDRLSQVAPQWRDRSEADAGMVLLELLAYAGDQLGYLRDRVALEGFLRTATQHESVRKLLRLVDYTLDPGRAGETFVLFELTAGDVVLPRGFAVGTRQVDAAQGVVYETAHDAVLRSVVSRVPLLLDAPSSPDRRQVQVAADLTGAVQVGDRLFLQQFDTSNTQAPLELAPVGEWVEVAAAVFGATTTLTFAAPLAGNYSAAGDPSKGIPPARLYGNAVAATHGVSSRANAVGTGAAHQAVALELAPITQVANAQGGSQAALSVRVDGQVWVEVEDFVDSQAADHHYRLSRDNAGHVTVHFGDGIQGAVPARDAAVRVHYRVGNGNGGQVAAGRLQMVDPPGRHRDMASQVRLARNPFASLHARDPESMAHARLKGPHRLRQQDRLVVARDYEDCLAQGVDFASSRALPLQSQARFRHTGSWHTVFVAVDMPDRKPLVQTPGLREALEAWLSARRMAGVDVRVEDARYCALHIGLRVEVEEGHFARDVRLAVEHALVDSAPGSSAFFAPGRFRFGQPVFLSDLYAVVAAVPGVLGVAVTRFKRLGDRYPDCEAAGVIEVDPREVARCDNDGGATRNGVVFIRTCGGKEG